MRAFSCLTAACVLGFGVAAIDRPAQAQDSEAEMQVLIEAMQLGAVMDQMSELMVEPISQAIARQNPGQGELIREVTREVVREVLNERLPALEEATVEIYTDMFSEQELNDIIAFYQTPTGQRMLDVLPELTQRGMEMGQEWGMQIGPVVIERLQERLGAEGIEVPR